MNKKKKLIASFLSSVSDASSSVVAKIPYSPENKAAIDPKLMNYSSS